MQAQGRALGILVVGGPAHLGKHSQVRLEAGGLPGNEAGERENERIVCGY